MSKQKTEELQKYRYNKGIYILYKDEEIVYIGISMEIYTRLLEHSYNGKDFNKIRVLSDNSSNVNGSVEFDDIKHAVSENYIYYQLIEMYLIWKLNPKENIISCKDYFQWYHSLIFIDVIPNYDNIVSISKILLDEINNSDEDIEFRQIYQIREGRELSDKNAGMPSL